MPAPNAKGRLDYWVRLNKPFAFGSPLNAVTSSNAANVLNKKWSTGGYFNYMYWDKESNVLPYFAGTYLGSKRVFNIGAGWYFHNGATASRKSASDSVQEHSKKNIRAEHFP